MNTTDQKSVILCDFDGTIIENDGCDVLMENHSIPDWEEPGKKYLAKQITHAEMNSAFVSMLSGDKSELTKTIKNNIIIRNGFKTFIKNIAKKNITLVVISAGWDLYITETLNFLNFDYIVTTKVLIDHIKNKKNTVPLVTNQIISKEVPTKWQIQSPWLEHACQRSTPCKGVIAEQLKNAGFKIIAIGNSETDLCMTNLADLTFATGGLVSILKKQKQNHIEFENFNDVSSVLLKQGIL